MSGREVYPDYYREVPSFAHKIINKSETCVFRFFSLKSYDLLIAQMVELVDTLVSGTSGRKAVGVRVPFWVQQGKLVS